MPKRNDIQKVLVIGAGPIVIGQACEFDYSGTQACKALREEGLKVILVNSNPATIMTDVEIADATYIEPLTVESLEKIIIKEKPDSLLSTVGGQTALNLGLALHQQGILKKYSIEMIGANPAAIEKAENRELFNKAMKKNGLKVPRNAVVSSLEEALVKIKAIGLPSVIRPSFTLGGEGGGIAENLEEFKKIVTRGLKLSPTNQVLIDESILGWKEFEMEIMRDKNDNAIVICSIENLDPMGVHTGDSITVAPALTLTDREYQELRDASFSVIREIGVETGGSNVQFAVNPENGDFVVIEMNPRVSRSSALASKATGFPIAKVAAKLAIGLTLDEIQNDITGTTPASFEPTIDYIVTKIPRFNFEKFSDTEPVLSSSMRSVGEVMSIGRNFSESLQKGLCSLEVGLTGLNSPPANENYRNKKSIRESLKTLSPNRLLRVGEAFRYGITVDEIYEITKIDPWFLRQVENIIREESQIKKIGVPQDKHGLFRLKKMGFSDARIAELTDTSEKSIRNLRHQWGVRPVYKTVDTCAAEFESKTSYFYSCYEGSGLTQAESETASNDKNKVIILGSGPNRIGQGIEFDYTCVHAAKTLTERGLETIMVNCNPETVSTDYDTSDKLYFEPLFREHVIELIQSEQQQGNLLGVIVQLGGQTPLKLSACLEEADIPILGTSPDSIDLAENRDRFQALTKKLELNQAQNGVGHKLAELPDVVENVGYPVMVRPSNVLGGRAMAVLHNRTELNTYLRRSDYKELAEGPILVDRFLENAIEIDVDAVCDGEEVFVAGIMEHIERAGIHSGDSSCVIPPYSLSDDILEDIRQSTTKLSLELSVKGPINIQYALKKGRLYVLEANPRASRTIPFVAKATGIPLAKICSEVIVGKKLKEYSLSFAKPQLFSVKSVVFPFARFANADVLLGPEMKSTGESMGHSQDLFDAFAKAQLSAFNPIPTKPNKVGTTFYSTLDPTRDDDTLMSVETLPEKPRVLLVPGHPEEGARWSKRLKKLGFTVVPREESGELREQAIDFAIVTDSSPQLKNLRRSLMMSGITYFTRAEVVEIAIGAMSHEPSEFDPIPIQNFSLKN